MIFKKTIVLFIGIVLSLSIITNSMASNYSEDDFVIDTDSFEKTIRNGENATFNWTVSISNNVKLRTFEFLVGASNSNFSEDHFTLKGGETRRITQILHPTMVIENESIYSVSWRIIEYFGIVKVETYLFSGIQIIHIINETNNENNIFNNTNETNENYFGLISFTITILVILILTFYYKRKK